MGTRRPARGSETLGEEVQNLRHRYYDAAKRRDARAVELYDQGLNKAEIGRRLGLTRERVRQIVKMAGR